MPVSENDLELLENLLDGELSGVEAKALHNRMADEPALAAAMESLRTDRSLRRAVWKNLEPDETAVEHVISGVRVAVSRREKTLSMVRGLRWASAAAACIIVGFLAGQLNRQSAPQQVIGASSQAVTSIPSNNENNPGQSGPFRVALTDGAGKIIAVQNFGSLDEAREFNQDFDRWQTGRRESQDSHTLLIADEF